ncbi:MAG: MarC family protein [Rhabdochlamydiaceae bacterium]
MNSLGNIPIFVGMLGEYPVKRQRRIILRELLIALGILILFTFFGRQFLGMLGISHGTIGIAGGTLLFLISLTMIFPNENAHTVHRKEPFIFPLATPVVAGPGALTAAMIYAQQVANPFAVCVAIFIAWFFSSLILLASSNIKLFLGQKGLLACEKLGGMLICLISVQMFTEGLILVIREGLHP